MAGIFFVWNFAPNSTNMETDILEKILFGIKVANANVIVLNEKVEELMLAINLLEEKEGDASSC